MVPGQDETSSRCVTTTLEGVIKGESGDWWGLGMGNSARPSFLVFRRGLGGVMWYVWLVRGVICTKARLCAGGGALEGGGRRCVG